MLAVRHDDDDDLFVWLNLNFLLDSQCILLLLLVVVVVEYCYLFLQRLRKIRKYAKYKIYNCY